jgi:RecB family endonuclease NucS
VTLDPPPDIVFVDPKTNTYVIVECKNSIAKLDAVDSLKKTLSSFGSRAKGILIAPSITNAAMKELSKAGLEFEPLERIEYGVYGKTS